MNTQVTNPEQSSPNGRIYPVVRLPSAVTSFILPHSESQPMHDDLPPQKYVTLPTSEHAFFTISFRSSDKSSGNLYRALCEALVAVHHSPHQNPSRLSSIIAMFSSRLPASIPSDMLCVLAAAFVFAIISPTSSRTIFSIFSLL